MPKIACEFINPAAETITGYAAEEFFADPKLGLKIIRSDERTRIKALLSQGAVFNQPLEVRCRRKDGKTIWIEVISIPLYDEKGRLVAAEGTARDITARKKAEMELAETLKNKEVLLRELYGRVNNSMQLIVTLLRLRERNTDDDAFRFFLRDLQNKIRSMALLHQKIYEAQRLFSFDLSGLLRELMRLAERVLVENGRVKMVFAGEPMPVSLDAAVNLGYIFNELVTNAVHHGFPEKRKGNIFSRLYYGLKKELILEVWDDGVGVPDDFEPESGARLGLNMVLELTEKQFGGRLNLLRRRGVHWQLIVPYDRLEPKTARSR